MTNTIYPSSSLRPEYQPTPSSPPIRPHFLDSGLIPSLPPPGASSLTTHHELMGRKNPLGQMTASPAPRPGLIKRSSSFGSGSGAGSSGKVNGRGGLAGVGAGKGVGGKGGHGHGRTWSASSVEGDVQPGMIGSTLDYDGQTRQGNQRSHSTSSVLSQNISITKAQEARPVLHDRGSGETIKPAFKKMKQTKPSMEKYKVEECIRLGTSSDRKEVTKLLTRLAALTPQSRMSAVKPPPPHTGALHPTSLLIPLAIIVEALATERDVFRGLSTGIPPELPALRDGSTLQEQNGSGELDWSITRKYVVAISTLIESLLPFITRSADGPKVEEMKKSIRVYVGKTKKVFGEVASVYMDRYGFMKGWWDDRGMKGAAAEVGRWGEMFDA